MGLAQELAPVVSYELFQGDHLIGRPAADWTGALQEKNPGARPGASPPSRGSPREGLRGLELLLPQRLHVGAVGAVVYHGQRPLQGGPQYSGPRGRPRWCGLPKRGGEGPRVPPAPEAQLLRLLQEPSLLLQTLPPRPRGRPRPPRSLAVWWALLRPGRERRDPEGGQGLHRALPLPPTPGGGGLRLLPPPGGFREGLWSFEGLSGAAMSARQQTAARAILTPPPGSWARSGTSRGRLPPGGSPGCSPGWHLGSG